MKIFLDTNFIIDWLFRDEYKSVCKQLLDKGNLLGYQFAISFLSLANLAYIARKQPKHILYNNLLEICQLFEIIPNNRQHIIDAVKLNATDFEDALQYQSAIDANCQYIISRNVRDFKFSKIPIMSASEFLDIKR